MNVDYTYTNAVTSTGEVWLCLSKLTIGDSTTTFFESSRSKSGAQKKVIRLIAESSKLRDYISDGARTPASPPRKRANVRSCATGCSSLCYGCYECNDCPRKRLSPRDVSKLDDELEKYMSSRH